MKLMTLNLWGGHVREPLLQFIENYSSIDFFCFQEVYHNAPNQISSEDRAVSLNIFSELQQLLPNHQGYFRPVVNEIYGISIFVKKEITVLQEGDMTIYENQHYPGRGPSHSRNLQWVECETQKGHYYILNVHGLWNGQGKFDCDDRINQSNRIRNFMDQIDVPKILCGDFNLRPDIESMKIIEHNMNNLIKTYQVTGTRTRLYPKSEKYADYILVSPEITVNQFKVLNEEVSDHAPLFLDFN